MAGDADARFRAKMAARAAGTAPVFEDEPLLAEGDDQAAIDARYQAKLARHNGKVPPAPAPVNKPKGEKSGESKGKEAEQKTVEHAATNKPEGHKPEGEKSGEQRR